MAWALVSENPQEVEKGLLDELIHKEIPVPKGTIVAIIVYDGIAKYEPPKGTRLVKVPDTAKIGDSGY